MKEWTIKIELFSKEKNRIFAIGIVVDCFPIIANNGMVCIDSSGIERKAKERNNSVSRLLHIRTSVVCMCTWLENDRICYVSSSLRCDRKCFDKIDEWFESRSSCDLCLICLQNITFIFIRFMLSIIRRLLSTTN